jgi:phage gp46-like protein
MDVRMRVAEGCSEQPLLLWDSLWQPAEGAADWSLAGPGAPLNSGGLAAERALETAVVLALFTDRRAPPEAQTATGGPGGLPPRLDDGDPRGWWGDGIDLRADDGETDLGSHLWLLERSPLTYRTARAAEIYAREALDPLLRQQAVARIELSAAAVEAEGRLELTVALYGRDGSHTFDRRFDIYWRQAADR